MIMNALAGDPKMDLGEGTGLVPMEQGLSYGGLED